MQAAQFSISDSESEPSEELEGSETDQSSPGEQVFHHVAVPPHNRHTLILPEPRMSAGGRIRLNSESNAAIASRDDDLDSEDGVPFRGRSLSAPPALWAAQKYGRQLRRMSDEFDSLLDKGGIRRVKSSGNTGQMHHSKSWWNYLFSHQETEGENSHSHDSHSSRTE